MLSDNTGHNANHDPFGKYHGSTGSCQNQLFSLGKTCFPLCLSRLFVLLANRTSTKIGFGKSLFGPWYWGQGWKTSVILSPLYYFDLINYDETAIQYIQFFQQKVS